ncbi:MAG TPA: hypothetical protein VGM82_02195 [Gemmatimonadaceae bacterium]
MNEPQQPTNAQQPKHTAQTPSTPPRRVDGRVSRGTREGQQPLANQWVILHRVGPDRAAPLDSVRSSAKGDYAFRYRPSGDSTAIYFVSTSYGGVAYFTPPFRSVVVKGDDASLIVFDTTSTTPSIKLGGRHLIVGAPRQNGARPIAEVYDLENDTTVTFISRDSTTPVWTAHIPATATGFQLTGDVAAGGIVRNGSSVGLFVPLSPGIRQFAFTYDLPSSAFPLKLPAEQPIGVFEVMVQEPTAHVQGPAVREVAPVNAEGRNFRRFLAQDIPPNAIVQVDVPRVIGAAREKVYIGVGTALLAAMAAALVLTARRSFSRTLSPSRVQSAPKSEALLRTIADLDAQFERNRNPDDAARAAYEARRAELKSELMGLLAAERKR